MASRHMPFLVAALSCVLASCGEGPATANNTTGELPRSHADPRAVAGGDATRGRAILANGNYGCGACHAIPGIDGARGTVGPPLHAMGLRAYVAGRLPNTPGNLVTWIENPRLVDPRSAMPATGITKAEATDVAAYLYTLRALP